MSGIDYGAPRALDPVIWELTVPSPQQGPSPLRTQYLPPMMPPCTCGNRYDALLKLLAVSTEMRAFLDALAKAPADAELLSIFADWLEEQGKEAGKFRELAQEDGDPS